MTTSQHNNNFDLLRIMAAVTVLFDHQFPITGVSESVLIWHRSLGELAVEIFFAVSGFLVAQSWQLDPHAGRFAAKRVLRIWPGLLVMLLVTVLIAGPLLSSMPAAQYFGDGSTWRYLADNSTLHTAYRLPGVFGSNPYPNAVNGSLWTLPYEMRWYLILLVLGLCTFLGRAWLIVLIWAVVYINYFFRYGIDTQLKQHGDHHYAAELGCFFLAGTMLHSLGAWWMRYRWAVAAAAGAVGFILAADSYFMAAAALFVPPLCLAFGTSSTPILRRAGRYGDPSYGIYIYAFLVQQSVTSLTQNRLGYWGALPISLVTTVVLGYVSWHLVERPGLRIKKWFGRPLHRGGKLTASQSDAASPPG